MLPQSYLNVVSQASQSISTVNCQCPAVWMERDPSCPSLFAPLLKLSKKSSNCLPTLRYVPHFCHFTCLKFLIYIFLLFYKL